MFVALFALNFVTPALFADEAETRRQAFAQGFEQLLKNTNEGLSKSANTGEKFAIAPVTVGTTTHNLGIKVWFTLEDGTAFNPVKRKMAPKERFYVHIQSAVPVYVSLFQNYLESRPESKQVYPDAKDSRNAEMLKVIQANVATKLPVAFEMDDDTRDEIMAMVVVRADAPQIQATLVATPTQVTTTTTITTTGTGTVTVAPATTPASAAPAVPSAPAAIPATNVAVTRTDEGVNLVAQATPSTLGTMKSINDGLAGKTMEDPTKFAIASPTVAATTTTVPNDVAFYMLGTGYAGQWQLTLKK